VPLVMSCPFRLKCSRATIGAAVPCVIQEGNSAGCPVWTSWRFLGNFPADLSGEPNVGWEFSPGHQGRKARRRQRYWYELPSCAAADIRREFCPIAEGISQTLIKPILSDCDTTFHHRLAFGLPSLQHGRPLDPPALRPRDFRECSTTDETR